MNLIDTNDYNTIKTFEQLKKELEYQQKKKNQYDIDDFALIRTTNHLPSDHLLKSLSRIPFVVHTNNIASSAIYGILEKEYNIYDENEYSKLMSTVYKYSPLSTQYRSTIHFTLNGLVSNHNKGTFNNKNYIIIDNLKNHLGIDDFRSIRMEDTFIYGEFSISDEAIILIEENKFSDLIKKNPWLETYENIVIFRGDETLATQIVLANLGIVPENIEAHSAEYSERTPLYQAFFNSVTEKLGIEQEKHYYSKEYSEDDEKNLILWEIYNHKFYDELFNQFKMDESRKKEMMEFLLSYQNDRIEQVKLLRAYILEIGLENYQSFVLNYNEQILTAIDNNIYPTNDEIINMGFINLKDQPKKSV